MRLPSIRLAAVLGVAVAAIAGGAFAAEPAAPATPTGPTVGPEGYLIDPVDDSFRGLQQEVRRILQAGAFGEGDQEIFDNYYQKYELPSWTIPGRSSTLPTHRRNLVLALQRCGVGDRPMTVHDYFVGVILNWTWQHASQNYHPSVRVHATLMLGDLNGVESLRTPTPLEGGRNALLGTLDAMKQPGTPKHPDIVQVAALTGILRHARLSGDEATRRTLGGAMYTLVRSPRPAERTPAGHAWMQAQAMDVLGELKMAGSGGVVAVELAGIAGDLKAHFVARCAAAKALGKLNYREATGLDLSQVAMELGEMGRDACRREGPQTVDDPENLPVVRRRLKTRISAVLEGLAGLGTVSGGTPHDSLISDIDAILTALSEQLDDATIDDVALLTEVYASHGELVQLVGEAVSE